MRILVLLKQVPDPSSTDLNASAAFVMNPADESALETALALRDAGDCDVTVMTMAPKRAESMLRDALARGADNAVMLSDRAFAGADTLTSAKCLSNAIRAMGGFDLILCGRRATDGETGQVGPMTASVLDISCVYNVLSIEVSQGTLTAKQLTESGVAQWETRLPALVTMCEWSKRLRLATIRGMREAARADIKVVSPSDIGSTDEQCGLGASPTRVMRTGALNMGVRRCEMISAREAVVKLAHGGLPI